MVGVFLDAPFEWFCTGRLPAVVVLVIPAPADDLGWAVSAGTTGAEYSSERSTIVSLHE
jgi:hypothetical protein